MEKGKNINVFLKTGTADGIIKCTIANWLGVAYKIPRTLISSCKSIDEYEKSGVYFLFGKDNKDRDIAYIGQAIKRKTGKGLVGRICEPHPSIEWTECILFTTKDDSFGATEISYLENIFTKVAREVDRYDVKNDKEPNAGNVTEEKESELSDFFDYAKLILTLLGHKVLEIVIQNNNSSSDNMSTNQSNNNSIFFIKGKCFQAMGMPVSDGFVVLKDSTFNEKLAPSCHENILKKRKTFKDKVQGNRLIANILFSSPSNAAGFVCGYSVNGLDRWQTQDGKKLADML